MLRWLTIATSYVANTPIGKQFVLSYLEAIRPYLKNDVHPAQLQTHEGSVLLQDLEFDSSAINKHLQSSPLLVSTLWAQRASFSYHNKKVSIDNVMLVAKWNTETHSTNTSVDTSNPSTTTTDEPYGPDAVTDQISTDTDWANGTNDLIRRFVNSALHGISFQATNITITLETAHESNSKHFLRMTIPAIDLSRTENLSEQVATDIPSSAILQGNIHKVLTISPLRVDLFSSPTHASKSHHDAPSENGQPAILVLQEATTVNIGATFDPALGFDFCTALPPIYLALHSSQLHLISDILSKYHEVVAPISESGSKGKSNSAPKQPLSHNLPPKQPLMEDSKVQEPTDDEESEYLEKVEVDVPPPTLAALSKLSLHLPQPPIPPQPRVTVDISAPLVSFAYASDDDGETSPFLQPVHLESPHLTNRSFIHIILKNNVFKSTPEAYTLASKLEISENFVARPESLDHMPRYFLDMFPTQGRYSHLILSTDWMLKSLEAQQKANTHGGNKDAPFALNIGHTVITLPLWIPKLCNRFLSDIHRAFPPPPPPQPASPSACSQAQVPPQDMAPILGIGENAAVLANLSNSVMREMFISYSTTRISVKSLRVNLEIPSPYDIRFELPLRRKDRLVVECMDLHVEITETNRELDDLPLPDLYRVASASFSSLRGLIEKDFHKANKSTTLVILVEPTSSNSLEITSEPLRVEWKAHDTLVLPMTDEEIQHAPFRVPDRKLQLPVHREALSRQEFETLASHPSQLAIILTAHMIELNMSPEIYSTIMDAVEEYRRPHDASDSSSSSVPPPDPTELSINKKYTASPIAIDIRTKYGKVNFYVEKEPITVEQLDQLNPSFIEPLVYGVELELVRTFYVSRMFGIERNTFAVQLGKAVLKHDNEFLFKPSTSTLLEPWNPAEFITGLSYVYCSEMKGISPKLWAETNHLVELRHMDVAWTFTDTWPQRVWSIFRRIPHPESMGLLEMNEATNNEDDMWHFSVAATECNFAIWGHYQPNQQSPTNSSSPGLQEDAAPRRVATPQLLITPKRFGFSTDGSIYHVNLVSGQIFASLDRTPAEKRGPSSNTQAPPSEHRPQHSDDVHNAGTIRSVLFTCAPNNGTFEASMQYDLELDTTVEQLVALQFLYSSYLATSTSSTEESTAQRLEARPKKTRKKKKRIHATPSTPEVASSSQRPSPISTEFEDIELHSDNCEERVELKQQLSSTPLSLSTSWRLFRPPPKDEPRTRFCTEGANRMNAAIEDYLPQTEERPLETFRLKVNPTDVRWRFRNNAQSEDHMTLVLQDVRVAYVVDENDSRLFELTIRGVEAFSQLGGCTQKCLMFDVNGKYRRQKMLYFTWVSNLNQFEFCAPRSSWDAFKSTYLEPLFEPMDMVFGAFSQLGAMQSDLERKRFDRFRFDLLPLYIDCSARTFHFSYAYYSSYLMLTSAYENEPLPGQGQVPSAGDLSSTSTSSTPPSTSPNHIPSNGSPNATTISPSIETQRPQSDSDSGAMSPFFGRFYVGPIRVKLNIPGLFSNAEIGVPSVLAMNVRGWTGVAHELRSIYVPHVREIIGSLMASFPLVKVVSVAKESFMRVIVVPQEESLHGRSAMLALAKSLYLGLRDVSVQTIGAVGEVAYLAARTLGAAGVFFDVRDPSSIPLSEQLNPETISEGAQEGALAAYGSIIDAASNIRAPTQRYIEDPEYGLTGLVFGTVRAVPFVIISPLQGALTGVSKVLHGATVHMQSDHTHQPSR